MDGNRQRGVQGAVRGQQVRTYGGSAHAGDQYLANPRPGWELVRHPESIGVGQLVGEAVDLTDHIQGIELFKTIKVVQIHLSSNAKQKLNSILQQMGGNSALNLSGNF